MSKLLSCGKLHQVQNTNPQTSLNDTTMTRHSQVSEFFYESLARVIARAGQLRRVRPDRDPPGDTRSLLERVRTNCDNRFLAGMIFHQAAQAIT
jgi:hypothetical protein